jgi:hypothetical protein
LGVGGWGEIEIKAELNPDKAVAWAELGKMPFIVATNVSACSQAITVELWRWLFKVWPQSLLKSPSLCLSVCGHFLNEIVRFKLVYLSLPQIIE